MTRKVFLDVECYSNYFLICFKSLKRTKFYQLYQDNSALDLKEIKKIMEEYLTVGFNSKNYDLPMIAYALQGANNLELKIFSDDIIKSKQPSWEVCRKHNIIIPHWKHIDIIEPAPAVGIGLKMYGARMHTQILQDLPIEPDSVIWPDQITLIREYCLNDVNITLDLYEHIKDRIGLRTELNNTHHLELRSKSDAQVAETIIKHYLGIKSYGKVKIDPDKIYNYCVPSFIEFQSDELNDLLKELKTCEFKCNSSGQLLKSSLTKNKVIIGDTPFSVGVGGLHSNEKHIATIANENEFLINIDVISYYPSIILNNEYYPEFLGRKFLTLYKEFYEARIEAKKNKDKIKSETYKIVLNGSFGKFGSPYSVLYSPSLLLHTTLTGQLSLLMLIENLILNNIQVISANTDGITILGNKNKYEEFNKILNEWEEKTKFTLDKTIYKAIYHESVNSYIALLEDNTVKCKGVYANEGLNKNPVTTICIEALIQYLQFQIPIEETIYANRHDIKKFLVIRKVEGGALYKDQYLGKIVRWYYGLNGDKIVYKKNGNKVATSDGAIPLMILNNSPPPDIDFGIYIEKSYDMLKNLGIDHFPVKHLEVA